VQTIIEILKDIVLAIWSGLLAGLSDMINWSKPPREAPPDPNKDSHSPLKYLSNKDWRIYLVRESTAFLIVLLLLLILIRAGIGENRYIPSESMEPTLEIGDRLFVEKLSKHFKRKYERGDIVVFYPPPQATGGEDVLKNDLLSIFFRLTGFPLFPQPEAYIKRIIGLPGERVEVFKNQGVFIDGHVLEEPYHHNSIEFLPEYGTKSLLVPEGHYFVMGDNRNNSSDSHVWGFLAHERIIGRAAFIFFRLLNTKPTQDFSTLKTEKKNEI
jgi:signal peptidase I